jgi:hypothetical protein
MRPGCFRFPPYTNREKIKKIYSTVISPRGPERQDPPGFHAGIQPFDLPLQLDTGG